VNLFFEKRRKFFFCAPYTEGQKWHQEYEHRSMDGRLIEEELVVIRKKKYRECKDKE
jgi:hypothetical protein